MAQSPSPEPDGTVRRLSSPHTRPRGKIATITVKSAAIPPSGEVRYTWHAVVARHPYSDLLGYTDEAGARDAAKAWIKKNFPDYEIEE